MSDDLLREAIRAVREITEDSGGSAAFTRMRVMHSLHGARRRRLTRVVVWAPLAAVLAGATAAAATGQVPRVWLAIERTVLGGPGTTDEQKPPAVHKARARSAAGAKALAPEPATALEEKAESDTPDRTIPESDDGRAASETVSAALHEAVSSHKTSTLASSQREAGSSVPTSKPSAPPSDEDVDAARELALYRTAHRAHFQYHDYEAAVLAWDRYLAEAPRGRFTIEARYNRALCLIRLGREREAASALGPFARGSYGGYRQSDARALLNALESRDSGAR